MSEHTAPVTVQSGQPEGTGEPAPQTEPQVAQGQADTSKGDGQGQAPETTQQALERFLTIDDVPEDMRPHVEGILSKKEKEMQAAFTKKTQALAQDRQKLEAYKMFEADPINTIMRVAQQYGLNVAPAHAPAQSPQQQENWEPQTWDEVIAKAEERATTRIIEQLRPVLQPLYQSLGEMKSQGIETQLAQIDPSWKIYEDEIKGNMEFIKPDLLKTPEGISKLYRMSVPEEVLNERATQAALKKFEEKAKAAKVDGGSKSRNTTQSPQQVRNFNEAVAEAKRKLNLA